MRGTDTVGLRSFRSDEGGSIAAILGLSMMMLAMAIGVALDYSRVLHQKSRIVASLDAAALVAGRALLDGRLSDQEVKDTAAEFFQSNVDAAHGSFGIIGVPDVTLNRATGSVEVSVQATVPMTLTQIAGFTEITLPVKSTAQFEQNDIEISLALDVTGSMNAPGKMDALKTATKDLVDILIPDGGTPNEVRIALAPYASGVNAGPLADAVSGGAAPGDCVYEREGTEIEGHQAPGPGEYIKNRNHPDIGSSAIWCPNNAVVVPLTDDKSLLKDSVDAYNPTGPTAGHTGTAWASYLLSEDWAGILPSESAPAAFNDDDTIKAMVIMSDGVFNTIGGKWGGDISTEADQSQQLAVDICNAIRSKNVIVYAVGFKLDDISNSAVRTQAQATLQSCAGDPSRYFDADNAQALRDAFISIAIQVNNLRLSS